MMTRRVWSTGILTALVLTACVPLARNMETPVPPPAPAATIPISRGDESVGYVELVDALGKEGVEAEPAGEVEQPFFGVAGQVIEIDGGSVQVFEYEDEAAREVESARISPDGSSVGGTSISWVDRPTFWAEGRLIVLYVGADEAIVDLLTRVLGAPIAQGESLPPDAAIAAEQMLGQSLGVSVEEIELVSYERREWPNACLGLPEEGEMCAQVITPGWRVVLRVGGQEYAFRTDRSGDAVRQEGVSELFQSGEPVVVARGEFVGVGGHEAAGTATVV
jgi:hypothetical protein